MFQAFKLQFLANLLALGRGESIRHSQQAGAPRNP
jgi:hypothetical protein